MISAWLRWIDCSMRLRSARSRASEATARLVAALVGGDSQPASVDRRLRELGNRVDQHGAAFGFVAGVVTGNVRLLLGMLRANRPWRLAIRLSRALVAAVTASARPGDQIVVMSNGDFGGVHDRLLKSL